MADIVITQRSAVHSTTQATSYPTDTAFTPASGSLMRAWVISHGGTDAPTSVSGNGVTYSMIKEYSDTIGGSGTYFGLWAGIVGGSPSNGVVTASGWGTNRTGCHIMVAEITNADVSGTPANAFVQTPDSGTGNVGTSGSITLAAAGNSANRPDSAWVHAANEVTDFRTNWTELDDGGFNSPTMGAESQWRSDAFETTASASWATSRGYMGIAAEIKAAAAGGGGGKPFLYYARLRGR